MNLQIQKIPRPTIGSDVYNRYQAMLAEVADLQQRANRMADTLRAEIKFVLIDFKGEEIAAIQTLVAAFYGMDVRFMKSPRRDRRVAWPRQVAMCLCREMTEATLGEIGGQFGGRDHGTVLHACDAVRDRVDTDASQALAVHSLKASIFELLKPKEKDSAA